MRADMAKVATERERAGPRMRRPKGYRKEMARIDEDSPKGEKISRKWVTGWQDGKQPTETIKPILGWLYKQCGRAWDDIWSELRERFSHKSRPQSNLIDRVMSCVERDVFLVNGMPHYKGGMSHGYPITCTPGRTWDSLYVCPESGLLLRTPERRDPPRRPKPRTLIIDKSRYFQKHRDIWYELTMAVAPDLPAGNARWWDWKAPRYAPDYSKVFCIFRKRKINLDGSEYCRLARYGKRGGKYLYPVAKRQLNKQEIRRLVLPHLSKPETNPYMIFD